MHRLRYSQFVISGRSNKWCDACCLSPSNRELISASPSRKSHLAFSGLMAISSVGRVNFLHEGCEMASRRKINGRRPWIGKKMRVWVPTPKVGSFKILIDDIIFVKMPTSLSKLSPNIIIELEYIFILFFSLQHNIC